MKGSSPRKVKCDTEGHGDDGDFFPSTSHSLDLSCHLQLNVAFDLSPFNFISNVNAYVK